MKYGGEMLKTQIVSSRRINLDNEKIEIKNYFEDVESLSLYDLNIIDLNDADWTAKSNNYDKNDGFIILESLGEQLKTYNQTKVILILPTEATFNYDYNKISEKYNKNISFKDDKNIFLSLLDETIFRYMFSDINLVYENTIAKLCESEHYSTYYIIYENKLYKEKLKDIKNNRVLALRNENVVITTINLLDSVTEDEIKTIYQHFFLDDKEGRPKWFEEIECFDDSFNKKIIEDEQKKILDCKKIIESKLTKLDKNNYYKSILYSNGDCLVEVVFSILEEILNYNLSEFIDNNKEDFLLRFDNITLIGEIKGIGTGVKSGNISQVDRHLQNYSDKLQEEGKGEILKGILIINPQRNINPLNREKVHEIQIKLAERNGCLIILTEDLLKLYEKFVNKEIETEKILEIFKNEIGLFSLGLL